MRILKHLTYKRLRCHFFMWFCNAFPIRGFHRYIFVRLAGVNIIGRPLIYKNVYFDTTAPELITIEDHVTITQGTTILTHFLTNKGPLDYFKFRLGKVKIERDVFIGCNVTICNSVTIGRGSIVGAGSVVTKDIPPYQVWAGNPARYIKDREH